VRIEGATLAGRRLSRASLTNVELVGVQGGECRLGNAVLTNVVFRDCDLRAFDVAQTDYECRIRGIRFERCQCEGAEMGGRIDRIEATETDFTGTNLVKGWFTHAQFRGLSFRNANMLKLIVEDADLAGCDLSSANLLKTAFKRTNLEGCIFQDALMDRTWFKESRLVGARGRPAQFVKVHVTQVIASDDGDGTQVILQPGMEAQLEQLLAERASSST
jgi:uncharacterized protein YjbI with pentapeptide repeats